MTDITKVELVQHSMKTIRYYLMQIYQATVMFFAACNAVLISTGFAEFGLRNRMRHI